MARDLSPWPARVELVQGLSGLLLVLFVWVHMFFESSILLGEDAMYWVTGMFEGKHLFGESYPVLVSLVGLLVLALVVVHAVLALGKMPASYRRYAAFYRHMRGMRHPDTTLWLVQVITGFLLFFLIPVHLYTVIVQPGNIGPYASSDRIWTGRFWILYALLLLAVHLHAGVGIYRLIMKWAPPGPDGVLQRPRLRNAARLAVVFFLALGFASLITYMRIGAEHADRAGERYQPATLSSPAVGG